MAELVQESQEVVNPPRSPTSRYFRCVIQIDQLQQLEVFTWLCRDTVYEVVWILHDKDVKTEEPDELDSQLTFENSQTIKPHYHMIVRVPKKITAKTMTKRFGGYVHFQLCSDPYDYARYLTHECFRAREKHRYKRIEVHGDLQFYNELLSECKAADLCEQWSVALKDNRRDPKLALSAVVKSGNTALVKSIMSHSYFYLNYFSCLK